MENLKPCPFCGGEAETDCMDNGNDGWWYSVICIKPMCRCGIYNTEYCFQSEEEAVKAWNRRATDADSN